MRPLARDDDGPAMQKPISLIVERGTQTVVRAGDDACAFWQCHQARELAGAKLTDLLSLPAFVLAERFGGSTRSGSQRPFYTTISTPAGRREMVALTWSVPPDLPPGQIAVSIVPAIASPNGNDDCAIAPPGVGEDLETERNGLDLVFETVPVGLLMVDSDTAVVKANRRIFSLLDVPPVDVYGSRFGNLFRCAVAVEENVVCGTARACAHCGLRGSILSVLASGMSINDVEINHTFLRGGQRQDRWLKVNASPLELSDRQHALVAMDDITRRVALERELEQLSFADELSGLRNRRAVLNIFGHELDAMQRKGELLALAMLDIDDFKLYNDTYGHPAGDEVIRALGEALRGSLRSSDAAGRYGGEEFIVVMPGSTLTQAQAALERVDRHLAHTQGLHRRVTFSAGITSVTPVAARTHSVNALIGRADRLMYQAKALGKNRIVLEAS